MNKQIIALSFGLISIGIFAQKNELKTVEKAIKKQDFATASSVISSIDAMENTMSAKYKAKYYFLKGQAYAGKKEYRIAAKAFNNLMEYEKQTGKAKYTEKAAPMLTALVQEVSSKAVKSYNETKDYKNATENFYLTYLLSPKDTSSLFNAALSATKAKDLDSALEYYNKLKEIGYTGISIQYLATNKTTGQEENLGSKAQRDLMVKASQYSNPRDVSTDSRKTDIVKSIAYILKDQGKVNEAISAIKEVRASSPNDMNLLLAEADLYIKLKDMTKFGELMEEAVKMDPNNPSLFFNLGVVNYQQNKMEDAKKFYKKAIELDSEYGDAYMNLAVVILAGEKTIVDEMNENLNNYKKYEQLEKQQKNLYNEALPYLEKADNINRSYDTVKTLLNIYDFLEKEEKADALRPIYKEMRAKQ